ncbi:E3 ubiquitin-protein ligase TRIM71-like [Dysidea avara]|uniref:E3 ubiquitin-protein ligase TRIM71-like n=1 Tax=Dysidea avara TaxID=196820 RepID=UPI003331FE8D
MAFDSTRLGGIEEWQQIEEEITCSICGDLFTDPKTIPCLHTFCKRCIERSIESNNKMEAVVCCPLCRAPFPQDEVASIPTNSTVHQFVKKFKKAGARAGKISKETTEEQSQCGNCSGNLPAVTWCVECKDSFCHDCNEAHKKLKLSRWHKIVPIKDFSQDPKLTLSAPEKAEFCKTHKKQPLDLYCRTCSSLICRDCTFKDHPLENHDFDFNENMVGKVREKLEQVLVSTIKQLLEQVSNAVKQLDHCEKKVESESKINLEKIRATYDEVYKLLKQQEQQTIKKLNSITSLFVKRLSLQKENAISIEDQLVSCSEFCNKTITVNSTKQLLTYNKWIESKVDDLTKQVQNARFNPECKASDMVVRCCKPFEFARNLVCDVCRVPHFSDCTPSGPAIISNPVNITVTLKDVFGSLIANQSKDLEIRCDKEFLQNVSIEEESLGQYHIWYNPKQKETHSLSIYWRGTALNHKVNVFVRSYHYFQPEVKIIIDKYGPANNALGHPLLLAKGPNNELIVRDNSTNQLVVFDKNFQYSHVIGGEGSGNEKFMYITGIAVNKKGDLYIADSELHCIQKFKLDGDYVSQFGSKGDNDGEFNSPYGLVLSQSGLLFVCDSCNNRIQVFQNGQFSYCFGKYGTCHGMFNDPKDIALNGKDQLFVADCQNNRVQVFATNGQFCQAFCSFTGVHRHYNLYQPVGIHYTPDGHLLVSCWNSHCVLVFEENGNFTSAIEGSYQGEHRFSSPYGIVMMDNGKIVISATRGGDHNVLVVL